MNKSKQNEDDTQKIRKISTKEHSSIFKKDNIHDLLSESISIEAKSKAENVEYSPEQFSKEIEHLEMEKYFASGGFCDLYVGQDKRLNRKVAIKLLRSKFSLKNEMRDMFISEAKITAQLEHPSIVPVHSIDNLDEFGPCLSMKLVEGRDLREYLSAIRATYKTEGIKKYDEKKALISRLDIFKKICEGVSFAHSRNIGHNDLKPENIMLGAYGEVYVMDWGLANNFKSTVTSEDGDIIGSPRYMSPEQITGNKTDQRSDIFALGLILFELATLKPALPGDSFEEVQLNLKNGEFNSLKHRFEFHLQSDLIAIIRKAISLNPEDRFQSVNDLLDDVNKYLSNQELSIKKDNIVKKVTRAISNHPAVTAILLLCFISVFAATIIGELYARNLSIQKAKKREGVISYLHNKISNKAHKIDSQFLHLEDSVKYLAAKAAFCLKRNISKDNVKIFSNNDFADKNKAPSDLVYSPAYKKELSFNSPGYKLPPTISVDTNNIKNELKILASLQKDFAKILFESGTNMLVTNSNFGELKFKALNKGFPLIWAYIGLKSGAFSSYPGHTGYAAEYDGRCRPWYKSSALNRDINWSKPYADASGQGMVMSCSTAVVDDEDKFHGVASVDIEVSYVFNNILSKNKTVYALEKYVIDENAKIILSYLDEKKDKNSKTSNKRFPYLEILPLMDKGEQNSLVINNGKEIIIFSKIPSLNWFYVEKINLIKLLEEKK